MRVVNAGDVEYRKPGTRHREGDISFKHLLRGEAGSPQNYELMLAHTGAGFPSPPHHHNFDQIRFCLSGQFGDGKGADVKQGQCGYYPEGGWYSIDSQELEIILLQFGGASGIGFTHFPQLYDAYQELAQLGEFRKGQFYRSPASNQAPGTPSSQDGYEALWQHIHGRPVTYPKPRYARPVIMDPDGFGEIEIAPGVSKKMLGSFTERAIETGLVRVADGESWSARAQQAPLLFYVLNGLGETSGAEWTIGTTVELAAEEACIVTARAAMTIFYVKLPTFSLDGPSGDT